MEHNATLESFEKLIAEKRREFGLDNTTAHD